MAVTEGMRAGRAAAAAALAAAWLAGCSLNPMESRRPAAPRVVGNEGQSDHARLVAAFGGEVRAPAAQRLLSDITARLVTASDRPDEAYQVTILNSPVVNAFA